MPQVNKVRVGITGAGQLSFNAADTGGDSIPSTTTSAATTPAQKLVVFVNGQNLGLGEGIYAGSAGSDNETLQFRSLIAGTGMSFTTDANTITLNSSGGGGSGTVQGGTNLGNGSVFYIDLNGSNLEFRSIRSLDSKLTVTQSSTEIHLALNGIGSAATADIGASAGNVPVLNSNNVIPASLLDLSSLGTAAAQDVGTNPNNVVQLDSTGHIPQQLLGLVLPSFGTAAQANTGVSPGNVPVIDGTGHIPNALLNIPTFGTAALADTGDAVGNVPVINAQGKIDSSLLPALVLSAVFVVTNVAARDAITSQNVGDIAIVSGTSNTYVWDGTTWQQILTPAAVVSVNGKSGAVTLIATDITGFATVATTGSYASLTNKPNLAPVATTGVYSDLTGKPNLATVALTGSYSDLLNIPPNTAVSGFGDLGVTADGVGVTGTNVAGTLKFKRLLAGPSGLISIAASGGNSVVIDSALTLGSLGTGGTTLYNSPTITAGTINLRQMKAASAAITIATSNDGSTILIDAAGVVTAATSLGTGGVSILPATPIASGALSLRQIKANSSAITVTASSDGTTILLDSTAIASVTGLGTGGINLYNAQPISGVLSLRQIKVLSAGITAVASLDGTSINLDLGLSLATSGTGGIPLYAAQISAGVMTLRQIKAGSANITVTTDGTSVVIDAGATLSPPSAVALGTLSDGIDITPNGAPVAGQLKFKRINAGSSAITVAASSNGFGVNVDLANSIPRLATTNLYTAAQNVALVPLTYSSSIAWNLQLGNVAMVTLAGAATLANPTNLVAGGTYVLIVKQDGSGSRTLAYGSAFRFANGTVPTISSAANSANVLSFVCDGSNMYGVAITGF